MNRLSTKLLPLAVCLAFVGQTSAQDEAVSAVAARIDPARLATLRRDRAANQRALKCRYWLNEARRLRARLFRFIVQHEH